LETHTQFPQKLKVWAGIIGDRILEPLFLDGNLHGATYLTLLQEDLIPALAALHFFVKRVSVSLKKSIFVIVEIITCCKGCHKCTVLVLLEFGKLTYLNTNLS
jgi:hypothetical protein